MSEELEKLRASIDRLDGDIVRLISERAQVARKIADLKARDGSPIFRPGREKQVYQKVAGLNKGPLQNSHLRAIYREIMSGIIDLEGGLDFCYLGPEASFSHQASVRKFGTSLRSRPVDSIPQIFREVEAGKVRYGVVPIENSTEGIVTNTLDQFLLSDLTIYSELYFRIRLFLLSHAPSLADIRYVYSHRQPIAQCREWLSRNLPAAELIETSSTSRATEMVKGRKDSASIGSELAADIYGVPILARSIEDNPRNYTRFLVIGYDVAEPTGDDKTSFVCSMGDKPGALFDLLTPLADRDINMSRIESRPSRRNNWEYNFFIDVLGHREDAVIREALEKIAGKTTLLKVLGSFPKGDEFEV